MFLGPLSVLLVLVSPGLAAEDRDNMMTCPYPPEESLSPCSCLVDDQIRVHLICNLHQPMDEEIMDKVSTAFACQNLVHKFEVNLHGHPWQVDFGPENFGLMNVRSFSLMNVSHVSGNILAGAFNNSASSLEKFKIEDWQIEGLNVPGIGNYTVKTEAFENLQSLESVQLGRP